MGRILIQKGCILSTAHSDSRHRKPGIVPRKRASGFTLTRRMLIEQANPAFRDA